MAAARRSKQAGKASRERSEREAVEARELASLPPWLSAEAARLRAREASGRLPHALLLRGTPGIGKREFAHWFVEALLCRAPTAAGACGRCASCNQLLAGAHPDYRLLAPDGTGIRIDAVRDLLVWMQMAAPEGRWRIALLDGADTMNRAAANALLKTLEEPAERALLVLVADRPGILPATVRSRCQQTTLKLEDRALALDWLASRVGPGKTGPADASNAATTASPVPAALLARAADAPYAALALAEAGQASDDEALAAAWRDLFLHRGSIGRIADSLAKLPAKRCLATFSRYIALALRRRAQLPDGTDPAETALISEVSDLLTDVQWFTVRDFVQRLHRIDSPSFRTQAVLEGLLADIRLMLTAQGD